MLIPASSINKIKVEQSTKVLLIHRIRRSINYSEFMNFINGLTLSKPQFKYVHFCFIEGKFSIILDFKNLSSSEKFYYSCRKRLPNFADIFGDKFSLNYLKDSYISNPLETDDYQKKFINHIYNKNKNTRNLYENKFVGLILRNLPSKYDCSELKDILAKEKIKVNIDQVCKYGNQRFALLTCKNIEEAENALLWMQKQQLRIGKYKIKANIHGTSNYKRDTSRLTLNSLFAHPTYDNQVEDILKILENKNKRRKNDEEIKK